MANKEKRKKNKFKSKPKKVKKKLKDIDIDIRRNYQELLTMQKVKKNRNVKVEIKGKFILNILEIVLTITKLLLALFAFVTVTIFAVVDDKIAEILKITTLVLTMIFVIINLGTTLFDKVIIRHRLSGIWGKNKEIEGQYIETRSFTSKATLKKKAETHGTFSIEFNNKINVFDNTIRVTFKNLFENDKFNEDETVEDTLLNQWIIYGSSIDLRTNLFNVEIRRDDVSIFLEIDLKNKKCSWSGKLPNNSNYGYWYWKDSKIEKKDFDFEQIDKNNTNTNI